MSEVKYAAAIEDLVKYRDELVAAIAQLERLRALESRALRGGAKRGRLPGRIPRRRRKAGDAGN